MKKERHGGYGLVIAEAVIVVVLFLCTLMAFDERLIDRQYAVTSEKITASEPLRIVLLTDLHSYVYGWDQRPVIERVEKMQPDLICLVGDIVDAARHPILGTRILLEGIVDLAPCVYVTGNHEYWNDFDYMMSVFDDLDVKILRNESMDMVIKDQRVHIYGLDDPDYTLASEYARFFEGMAQLDPADYNILLSHRPDPAELYATYGFDLALSGHAHGGQVRIPLFVNGLYAPDQGWFPPYAGGLYKVGGMDFVVSRGLAHYDELPRIFNRPEVVLVTVSQ